MPCLPDSAKNGGLMSPGYHSGPAPAAAGIKKRNISSGRARAKTPLSSGHTN